MPLNTILQISKDIEQENNGDTLSEILTDVEDNQIYFLNNIC